MNEEIRLKSGRVLTPNQGILGLEWHHGRWKMTEGYDNCSDEDWGCGGVEPFTVEERQEIAYIMIHRWRAWRDQS